MSRELALEVDATPLERARVGAVVVPLFADERPLRGSVGRADWRLCGKLSRLVEQGHIEGVPGEAALLATFGGLRTPLLLVLGAGSRSQFDARAYGSLVEEAVARALALRVASLGLPFPDAPAGAAAQERRAATLVAGAAAAMGEAPDGSEFEVRLLVGREEATRSADLLRRARPGRLPEAVALRLPAPAAPAGRRPEASGDTPRGSQLVK